MKAQYKDRPPVSEKLQGGTIINFSIEQKSRETTTGTETYFECDQVKVSGIPTKAEIIEAVMGSKYSIGAEFACINNKIEKPEEYAAYQAFRVFAKGLANSLIEQVIEELNNPVHDEPV